MALYCDCCFLPMIMKLFKGCMKANNTLQFIIFISPYFNIIFILTVCVVSFAVAFTFVFQ